MRTAGPSAPQLSVPCTSTCWIAVESLGGSSVARTAALEAEPTGHGSFEAREEQRLQVSFAVARRGHELTKRLVGMLHQVLLHASGVTARGGGVLDGLHAKGILRRRKPSCFKEIQRT